MNTKKFGIKITILSILFVSFYTLANLIFLEIAKENNISIISDVFYEQISNRIKKDIGILENLVDNISNNKKIKKVLFENNSYDKLDQEEKNIMIEQINMFEGVMSELSFVNTINVASIDGSYLFGSGTVHENFDVISRPWFKEEYLRPSQNAIKITDVHQDFTTGKNTMSIVRFINSHDNSKVIGVVVLDIFVDDLLKFVDESFIFGQLISCIVDSDGDVYLEEGITIGDAYKYFQTNDYKYYHISDNKDLFSNGNIKLELFFDKSSMNTYLFSEYADKLVILTGVILFFIMVISISIAFRPFLRATMKLKSLLEDISDEEDMEALTSNSNVRQIEIISETLEKSFDKKIRNLIYYDHLTGLANRKYLNILCKDLIETKSKFALIFIDLNNFKSINDVYGHGTGDELLIVFSKKLQKIFNDKGIVARYSGDEFVVIYKGFYDEDELIDFYNNKILSYFEKPLYINKKLTISIEFSSGCAIYPTHANTYTDLIRKSDFMMYKSKNSTLKDLVIFNNEIYEEFLYLDKLKNELKNGIKNNEFVLYYQPIINSKKEIKKAEALIRWNSSALGFVPPDKFIKYAEETRDIIDIGYWIVESACKTLKEYNDSGIFIQMSINVSPIQIVEQNFVDRVIEIIDENEIRYDDICLEITETVLLDVSNIVKSNILRLRNAGIKIALDDFGTGYSSFSYLKKYNLDILKLDRIFIKDNHESDFKIVENIRNIAKILDIQILVEGVEDEGQFLKLVDIGCDFLQGYYFSKPITSKELRDMIIDIEK